MQKGLKGVTLIEVLVASIILAITISAFLGLYVHNTKMILSSKQKQVIQSLFEREFENVRKLATMDDVKKYLYHNNDVTKPINSENPLEITVDGTKYELYYIDQDGKGKPYKLISLGADNCPYLKEDKDASGNFFGNKVMQVSLVIKWKTSFGRDEEMNLMFRGQDAINI